MERDEKGRFVKGGTPWNKDMPRSEETKHKVSQSLLGNVPWNKGKTGDPNSPNYDSRIRSGYEHSPETIQKMSLTKLGENNPFYGKHHTPETRQIISEAISGENHPFYGKPGPMTGKHHSAQTIGKMSQTWLKKEGWGERNHNWRGGLSFEPYGPEFNDKLKAQILERDGYTCQNPSCGTHDNLCVHHIDYDKKNNKPSNLITLCISCNGRANGDRQYWTKFFKGLQK